MKSSTYPAGIPKIVLSVTIPGGGGVLDAGLGMGVPLRVSNPDPV